MKKKAIKIAASTAVAASAFVAAAPAQQADAATNVNQLATDAQNAGTVLKWAISGSANRYSQIWTCLFGRTFQTVDKRFHSSLLVHRCKLMN